MASLYTNLTARELTEIKGIAAWHLLRKNETNFFTRSFALAAKFSMGAVLVVLLTGDFHAVEIATVQPSKFAAMESIWETQANAPMCLLVVPDAANECNQFEALKIPGLLSFLANQCPGGGTTCRPV